MDRPHGARASVWAVFGAGGAAALASVGHVALPDLLVLSVAALGASIAGCLGDGSDKGTLVIRLLIAATYVDYGMHTPPVVGWPICVVAVALGAGAVRVARRQARGRTLMAPREIRVRAEGAGEVVLRVPGGASVGYLSRRAGERLNLGDEPRRLRLVGRDGRVLDHASSLATQRLTSTEVLTLVDGPDAWKGSASTSARTLRPDVSGPPRGR